MTIGGGSSLAELTLFMEKQQRMQMDRDAQARAERAELEATSKAEKAQLEAKFEAKLEAQRLKNERQRQSLERLKAQATEVRLCEQQTAALQARLESLHASKLLSQEELYQLEDAIEDAIEAERAAGDDAGTDGGGGGGGGGQVASLIALSERQGSDAGFVRQLRRKHIGA